MDISRGFITKVIDEDKVNYANREGITPKFLAEVDIPVWNYVNRYYTSYKNSPSRTVIQNAFPSFSFSEERAELDYFISELKEAYRRNVLEDGLNDAAKDYTRDTQKAETRLRRTLAELSVTAATNTDVDLVATAGDRYDDYLQRAANPGINGIRSSWGSLDQETLGWQAEEFIVMVGEKFIGKSWKLLWLAHQAAQQGHRVLFVTNEMSSAACARRYDSIYSQIPYNSLRKGELSNVEQERYKEALEALAASSHKFVIAREGIQTVQDIETKAVEHDSTIIFGDSIYLFDPFPDYKYQDETKKLKVVSPLCKRIARNLGVPFIVTVQAGRRKTKDREINLDQIEYSNAFAQDADTVFFVHKDDVDKELSRSQIHLLKVRDGGEEASFYVEDNFNYMTFNESKDRFKPTTDIKFDDEEVIDLNG